MVTTASYKKSLSKRFKFITSINWALLLSVASHGLFFAAILPQLNLNPNAKRNSDSFSNTPVIELNRLEQTRLPDLTPRRFFNWEGINTLPNLNDRLPNIPGANQSSSFQFPLIDNTNSAIANIPPPPSLLPTPIYLPKPSPLPPPPPINAEASKNLPPNINFDDSIDEKTIDLNAGIKNNQSEIRAKLFPVIPEGAIPSPREFINRHNSKVQTNNGESSSSNDQSSENNNLSATNLSRRLPSVDSKNTTLSESIKQHSENTSLEEARKNYVSWAAEDARTGKPKERTLVGVYPKDACIRRLEGNTTYGVMVNPQGKVINTKLIKSSGYPIFNNQALKQIQAHSFANDTGANQPYHVYVNFNYDAGVCPSLSLSNLGKIPASKPMKTPSIVDTPQPKTASPEKGQNQNISNDEETNTQPTPNKPETQNESSSSSSELPVKPEAQAQPEPKVEIKTQPNSSSSQSSEIQPDVNIDNSSSSAATETSNSSPSAPTEASIESQPKSETETTPSPVKVKLNPANRTYIKPSDANIITPKSTPENNQPTTTNFGTSQPDSQPSNTIE